MALLERVENDLHEAIRSRDDVVLRTLRMLKSGLQRAEIAKRPEALTEIEEIKVLRTEVKRREESIVEYLKGKRQDLVDKEEAEAKVLRTYLPAGPDENAVRAAVSDAVAKTSASSPKDFGKVMGLVMKQFGANVDGNTVSKAVKEALSEKQEKA